MSDTASFIQAQMWAGLQAGANVLGSPVMQYRPSGVSAPISPGNFVGQPTALFDPSPTPYQFRVPSLYGKPIYYVLVDGSLIAVGDYLVDSAARQFFVIAIEPFLPIACVACNRVISILRPASATPAAFGNVPDYSGDNVANEGAIMTSWPASVLNGTKGERSEAQLPGDVRMPWVEVLLPYAGVDILTSDVITDDHGLRYKVSATELTGLGWRITAMLAMA